MGGAIDYGLQVAANIYVDSPFTFEQFAKANNINFPLLSDFNKDTAAAYGALYEDFIGFRGVAKRSAFVVDGEGNLQYAEVLENPKELPNFAATQEKLKELS